MLFLRTSWALTRPKARKKRQMHWRHVGCCREELCLSPACLTDPDLAVSQVPGVQQPGALLLQSPQSSLAPFLTFHRPNFLL